jgi:hypothetical protein
MTNRQNDKMTKWQNDEMTNRQNDLPEWWHFPMASTNDRTRRVRRPWTTSLRRTSSCRRWFREIAPTPENLSWKVQNDKAHSIGLCPHGAATLGITIKTAKPRTASLNTYPDSCYTECRGFDRYMWLLITIWIPPFPLMSNQWPIL